MKSRSKTVAVGKATKEVGLEPVAPKALPVPDVCPPKAFILPDSLSQDATIVTLAHPRTLKSTRYYHCKTNGFFEIKQFASEPSMKQSMLVIPSRSDSKDLDDVAGSSSDGYVVKTAAFFAVTPIDALFLLLPALSPVPKDTKEHKPMFLSLDDHIDTLGETSKHLRNVCDDQHTLEMIELRLSFICDKVEAGDEDMYRLNHEKLLGCVVGKAEAMVRFGLPSSMEAQFVKKPLEVPLARLLQEEQSRPNLPVTESTDELDISQVPPDTASPTATNSSFSESQSTTITVPSPSSSVEVPFISYAATEELKHSLRLRVALNFLLSSYVPSHLAIILENLLSSASSPLDFAPLSKHLSQLNRLKSEISCQARELMTGDSRKRALEDEEAALDREEKKRKKDEEEKKKRAGESRGIRDLKKVNVTGMKKMSAFFGKKS